MVRDILYFILAVVTSAELGYLVNQYIENRRKNEIKEICNNIINKLDEMTNICNEMKAICESISNNNLYKEGDDND